jgi:preprotein translocase subunit SecD
MTDRQRHGFVLLLVAGLIVLSLLVIGTRLLGHHKTVLGLDLQGGV